MICLPECANFLAADKKSLSELVEQEESSISLNLLQKLALELGVIISAGSLMMTSDKDARAANRSYLIRQDGTIAARYNKIHMFDADVGDGRSYRESDHFCPGSELVCCETDLGCIGLSICYDVRFAEMYQKLALKGAEILTIPAAFTQKTGEAHWHVLQRARAIETGCFVLASAQIGVHDDGRRTFGHSLSVNPWGKIIADAGTTEQGFAIAEIDLDEVSKARSRIRNLQHRPDYA